MGSNQPQFDVFLAHNSEDKDDIIKIADKLKERGLITWLDKEQIAPGTPFQDEIQKAIPIVKSAAIFIGRHGLGRWQVMELRSLIAQCVDRNIPVIPVLLPGVNRLPDNLIFLREYNYVDFVRRVDESDALDLLEWGITQRRTTQTTRGTISIRQRLESKFISVIGLVTSVVVFMVWIIIYITQNTSPPKPRPTISPSQPVQNTSPSDPALQIVYYAQGDKESVEYALKRLGPEWSFDLGGSDPNLDRASSTNAIWFGSNVSLKDVKLVAEKLLTQGVPIKVIRPFNKPSSRLSKSWVIDIGADHDCPNDKRVLTLREIRNAKEFLYRECMSWELEF